METLKIGLPKGSLQQSTLQLFAKAGIKIHASERSYRPACDDKTLEVTLVRAQEIPRYVEQGVFDCGITGYDWVLESNAKVKKVRDLIYAKSGYSSVRWVLAVPNSSGIKSAKDLSGKRVATELVNVVKKYFRKKKVDCEVEFSWGATEIKAPDLVDAIVELTETGTSLRANNLRIVEEVVVSNTQFISNRKSYCNAWKKNKIEDIAILLEGALTAECMVGLKMNLREKELQKILKILPALKKPTVSRLTLPGWLAIEVILEEDKVREIIPELKKSGAEGIIEYPLNKVIL